MLNEDRTSPIISPTNHQKMVLSKTKAAPTPQVAASEISNSRQLLVARDMLARLGLIQVADNQATVTDQGEEVMRNQNLIDDSGELTDVGRTFAAGETQQPPKPAPKPSPQQESLIQSLNKSIDL